MGTKRIKLWNKQRSLYCKFMHTLDTMKRAINLSDMGTGKTIVTLKIISDLFFMGKINKCIIVIRPVLVEGWKNHIKEYMEFNNFKTVFFDGKKKSQKEAETADIVIIGYEMLRSRYKNVVLDKWFSSKTCIVCDEASILKGTQVNKKRINGTKRILIGSKIVLVIKHIVNTFNCYFIALTGTPISKSPLNAYNLLDIYHNGKYTQFFAYRNTYCYMRGNSKIQFIVGYKNLEMLEKEISAISGRIELKDCVEMPPLYQEQRIIYMSKEHQNIYNQYKKLGFVKINDIVYSAKNVLGHTLRAHQLASDPGVLSGMWTNSRLETLLTDLDEIGSNKIIIACSFVNTMEMLYKILSEKGYKITLAYGKTKHKSKIEEEFKVKSQLLIGHRKTIGYGLNLQFCHYLINYETTYNVDDYSQCMRRINRAGQVNTMYTLDYIMNGTIDHKILESINLGFDLQDKLIKENSSFEEFM